MGNQMTRSMSEEARTDRSTCESFDIKVYCGEHNSTQIDHDQSCAQTRLRAPILSTKSISIDVVGDNQTTSETGSTAPLVDNAVDAVNVAESSGIHIQFTEKMEDRAPRASASRSAFAKSKMVSLDVPSQSDFQHGGYKKQMSPATEKKSKNNWNKARTKLSGVVKLGSTDEPGTSEEKSPYEKIPAKRSEKGKSCSPERPRQLKTFFSGCNIVEARLIPQLWNRVKQTGHEQPGRSVFMLMCVKVPEMDNAIQKSSQASGIAKAALLSKMSVHMNSTIDKVVNELDRPEELETFLLSIGKYHYVHVRGFGFKPGFWDVFSEVMIKKSIEWCQTQQRERQRNRQLQQSWMQLISLVVELLKKGYYRQRRTEFALTKGLTNSYSPGASFDARSSQDHDH